MYISFPRFVLLVIIPVLFSLRIFAQDYAVNLDKMIVKSELQGYYIEQVINATHEDSCIGYVQKGISNRQVPAVLLPTIDKVIDSLLTRSFPKQPGAKPLIIRLNILYIYELTLSYSQIACVQLSISFFEREDSSYFFKFQAGTSFDHGADDVTHLHPENIANAFEVCFDDFARRENKGKVSDIPVGYTDLFADPSPDQDKFAVFHAENHQPVIFRTYYDFRDNYPNVNFPYTIKYLADKDTTIHRATLSGGAHNSSDSIWGFFDGNYTYINLGKVFYRLTRSGNGFTTWIYDRDIKKDLGANIATSAMMAGFLGGAFIGGLVGGLGALAAGTSKEGEEYMIDPFTGSFTFQNPPDYLKLLSTTIFYISGPSPGGEIKVLYDGKEICRSRAGNYIKLELPSKYRKFNLTFQTINGPKTTEEIIPRMFNTETYHIRIKKDKEIIINKVFEELRKGILNSITDEQTTTLTSLN